MNQVRQQPSSARSQTPYPPGSPRPPATRRLPSQTALPIAQALLPARPAPQSRAPARFCNAQGSNSPHSRMQSAAATPRHLESVINGPGAHNPQSTPPAASRLRPLSTAIRFRNTCFSNCAAIALHLIKRRLLASRSIPANCQCRPVCGSFSAARIPLASEQRHTQNSASPSRGCKHKLTRQHTHNRIAVSAQGSQRGPQEVSRLLPNRFIHAP